MDPRGAMRCSRRLRLIQLMTVGLITLAALSWADLPVTQARLAQADLTATCPGTVPFGVVFDCAVSSASEVDSYAFSGAVNDHLLVSVLRTSGTLDPYVRIVKPNGVDDVCTEYTYSDLVTLDCSLPLEGDFTLRVADINATNTGGYQVFMQRLPSPGNAQATSYGAPVTGNLSSVIQADTRTFAAKQNDIINIRMLRTAGMLDPYFNVYNAQGSILAACSVYTYHDLAGIDCAIMADGTYTVVMGDTGQDNTGTYRLFIQRLNNPGGATPLAFGTPISASVGESAESDIYTFTGQMDDLLMIHLVQESGNLDPQFRVFNSVGTLVCHSYTYDKLALDDACAITSGGNYAIMIDDIGNQNIGGYNLYVQRLNNPGTPQALGSEHPLSGSVDAIGAFQTYQISAVHGSKLNLTVSITGGTLDPYVRIYSAGGVKVCEAYTYEITLNIQDCTMNADGFYTVLLSDVRNQHVGTYTLKLEVVGSVPDPSQQVFLPVIRR